MKVSVDLALVRQRLELAAIYKSVSGAGALDVAMRNGLAIDPAAFVLPLAQSADTENAFEMNGVNQEVQQLVGIVTAVRHLGDASAEAAIDAMRPFRETLFDQLINWAPEADDTPFIYGGGQVVGFANQILYWQDDFITGYFIRKD